MWDIFRLSSIRPIQPRIVPMGPSISNLNDNKNIVSNSARRLEVINFNLSIYSSKHLILQILLKNIEA